MPYLIVSFLLISIYIFSFLISGNLYFPLDDAYITIKQANNLIDGNLFSYSNSDTKTNSNTSFLFYLLTSFFLVITTKIINYQDWISATVFINFIFNYFLVLLSTNLLLSLSDKKNTEFVYIIFSTPAVIFSYAFGLETGLSIFLILFQYYSFKNKKIGLFTIVSCILAINRPENIILNIVYLLLLFKYKLFSKNILYFFLIILANISVPLLNYYFLNDIRPSGFSRISISLNNIFNN
jgi:hypothetical protein